MRKGAIAALTTLAISVFSLGIQAAAQSPTRIGIAAGYFKGNSSFDVVVREKRGTKLVLYINDKNHYKATANNKNWATFHRVKLSGSGKISFAKTIKGSDHKTYQKPIHYVRKYTVSNNRVNFSKYVAAAAKSAPASNPAPTPTPEPQQEPVCTNGTYINSAGNTVCSPESSSTQPTGATAQCVDGTYSFSQSRRGTCSHHGGVAQWL